MKTCQLVFYVVNILNLTVQCQILLFKCVTLLDDHMIVTTTKEGRSLKEVLPKNPLETLTVLGSIPILYENCFANISNIKELHLYNNKIEEIHPRAFGNLTGVDFLEIKYSDFAIIRSNTFDDLKLKKLVVAYNRKLETIEEGAFNNSTIETIEVSASIIRTLPTNVFQMISNFKNLDLSGNLLATIPPDFLTPNLIRFHFAYNYLKSIPSGIFNNHNSLQEIDLSNNIISSIDSDGFDNMPQLKSVNLAHNKLTKIDPRWFSNSSSVNLLNFHHNLIEEVPEEAFKNLHREVKEINLSENMIKNVSLGAFKGVKLRYLVLSNNNITCVETDFKEVFQADCTDLSSNPLDTECLKKFEDWGNIESSKGRGVCIESSCCA